MNMPPRIASTNVKPLGPEHQRLAEFKIRRDEKWAAGQALDDSIQYETDCAQRIESRLPHDCEFRGRSSAELAEVEIDRPPGVPRPSQLAGRMDAETRLREARIAAMHRDNAARIKARRAPLSAESAALGRLIDACEKYLDERGIQ